MLVSAVAVHDDNFLAAVARHFVRGFLQKFQLQLHAVGHRAGLVLGLKNLAKIIFRENHGKFLLGCMQSGVANVQKIRSQRQMRPVLFQDSKRKQARPFRLLNRLAKIFRRQLFPFHGKLALAARRN